ncbi:MAG: flippase-like domain-containing protein [Methanomicrobiales archaeon]|nr:flippase-like domain-containing protein [Methanomicrobiales archaeon]
MTAVEEACPQEPGSQTRPNRWLTPVLLLAGFIILLFFLIRSNLVEEYRIILGIDPFLFAIAFLLSLASIGVKVYRWQYLSAHYGTRISWSHAALASVPSLFFANITPGKAGDLYKAYYMRKRHLLAYLNGISMIFYERFSELSLLFLVGALFLFAPADENIVIMLEATLVILLILVAVYWRADFVLERLKRLLVRLPFTTPEICGDLQIRKLSVAPLAGVFAITLASLTLEFVRLWVVVRALGYSLSLLDTAVFLSIAVIAGLVSQIPLGIGVMEGSLDYLFRSAGLDPAGSMAIVLTDRVISMYFALVLGFVVSKFAFDEMERGAP